VRVARLALATCALVLYASAAHAQASYVAGSVSADVARMDTVNHTDAPGTGEAVSWSVRAGGAITPRFGVELDFTRASEIETDDRPDVSILGDLSYTFVGPSDFLSFPGDVTLPSILSYNVHTAQRTSTITAAAWARQAITARVALVYLGGIAFGRVERTTTSSFDFPIPLASIYVPSSELRTVDYTAGPMAGFEARIGLAQHVELVPGVRMMAAGGGWIIRPAVGIGWTF